MINYKKNLKEVGQKPEKQKRAAPSILYVSLVPESYHASYYEKPDPNDLLGPDFLDLDAESWMGIGYGTEDIHRVANFTDYSVLMNHS